MNDVGYLIAMTGNEAVNNYAINNFSKIFGEHGAYKLASSKEVSEANEEERSSFFTPNDDFINLSEAYRENPTISEINIKDDKEYETLMDLFSKEEKSIPLFIENKKGIYLISEFERENYDKKDLKLSYLGIEINNQEK